MQEDMNMKFIFTIYNELPKGNRKGNAKLKSSSTFKTITNVNNSCIALINHPTLELRLKPQTGQRQDEITNLLALYDFLSQAIMIKKPWMELTAQSVFKNFANLLSGKNPKIFKNSNFEGKKFEDFQKMFWDLDEFAEQQDELQIAHFVFALIKFLIFMAFKEKDEDPSEIEETLDCFPTNVTENFKEIQEFLEIENMMKKLAYVFKFGDFKKVPTIKPQLEAASNSFNPFESLGEEENKDDQKLSLKNSQSNVSLNHSNPFADDIINESDTPPLTQPENQETKETEEVEKFEEEEEEEVQFGRVMSESDDLSALLSHLPQENQDKDQHEDMDNSEGGMQSESDSDQETPKIEEDSGMEEISSKKSKKFDLKAIDLPEEKNTNSTYSPEVRGFNNDYPKHNWNNKPSNLNQPSYQYGNARRLSSVRINYTINFSHEELEDQTLYIGLKERILQEIQQKYKHNLRKDIVDLHYRIEAHYRDFKHIRGGDHTTIHYLVQQVDMIKHFKLTFVTYAAVVFQILKEEPDFYNRFGEYTSRNLIIQVIRMLNNIQKFNNKVKNRFYDFNLACLDIGNYNFGDDQELRQFMNRSCQVLFNDAQGQPNLTFFTKTQNRVFAMNPRYMKYVYAKILANSNLNFSQFQELLIHFEENCDKGNTEEAEQNMLEDMIMRNINRYEYFKNESEISYCLKLLNYYFEARSCHFEGEIEERIINKVIGQKNSGNYYLGELEISLFLVKQDYISDETKDHILKDMLNLIRLKKRKKKTFFKKIFDGLFGEKKSKIPPPLISYVEKTLSNVKSQMHLLYQSDSATYLIAKNLMESKDTKKSQIQKKHLKNILEQFQVKISSQDFNFAEIEKFSFLSSKHDFKTIQNQILRWCGEKKDWKRKKITTNLMNKFFEMKSKIHSFYETIKHFEKSLTVPEIEERIDLITIHRKIFKAKRSATKYLERKEFTEEIKREYDCFNLTDQMVNESKFFKKILPEALKSDDWNTLEDLIVKKKEVESVKKRAVIGEKLELADPGNPFFNQMNSVDVTSNELIAQITEGTIEKKERKKEKKKFSFETGKTLLEKMIREIKSFFERMAKSMPRGVYLSNMNSFRKPKNYEQLPQTLDVRKKLIENFKFNISLFQILETVKNTLLSFEKIQKILKVKIEEKNGKLVDFLTKISKYSEEPDLTSKELVKLSDKLKLSPKVLNIISVNLLLFNKLSPVLEVYKYFKSVGDVHINEIENEGDPDRYSLTNSDISRLKKIKKLIDNALIGYQEDGFKGFCKILDEKTQTSKLQYRYFNDIDSLTNRGNDLIQLSKDYLNQDVSGKDNLKILMENSKFQFKLNESLNEVYEVWGESNVGDRKKKSVKYYDDQSLEELRVKLSIASFLTSETDDKEAKDLIDKRECFLKIYATLLKIRKRLKKIYQSGYVYNLEQAVNQKYYEKTKKKYSRFKFDLRNKFNFSIRIRSFNSSKIIKDFDNFLECLDNIIDEINKNAITLLTTDQHYWLTYLTGAQYKRIIKYISNETKEKVEKLDIFNLMKYCFGEDQAKIILENNLKENSIAPSTIHKFNALEILENIQIDQGLNEIHEKEAEVINGKEPKKISFLGYNENKYTYLLRLLAVNNLEIKSANRLLFCNRHTKKYEIYAFLQKSLFNVNNDLFFCVDIHLLTRSNFNFFLSNLRRIISNPRNRKMEDLEKETNPFGEEFVTDEININFNIMIIVKSSTSNNYREELQKFNLIETYPVNILEYDDSKDENEIRLNNFNKMIPEGVFIYESSFSGLGKTFQIRKKSNERGTTLLTLYLAGDLNPKNIDDRLNALKNQIKETKGRKQDLHIKLDVMEGYEENIQLMDQILFQIIYLKCIPLKHSFLFFNNFKNFYIEIGNTFRKVLNKGLSSLQIFKDDPENNSLIFIHEVSFEEIDLLVLEKFNFNFVTNYLWMLEQKIVDMNTYEEFSTSVEGENMLSQVQNDKRLRLLLDQYIDHQRKLTLEKSSYVQIINFVKILSSQFEKFSMLPHFMPLLLQESEIGFSLRSMIINKIISLAKQYSWSTTSIIRQQQKKNKKILNKLGNVGKDEIQVQIKKEIDQYNKILERLPKWEQWDETKNSTLYFGHGCMKPIYKDPNGLPENLKKIIQANTYGTNEIPDFRNYSDSQFIREIGEALNRGREEQLNSLKIRTKTFKNKGYVITMDNYIKILLICQRADEEIPIILQGETGCGKTFMMNYISSCLLEDEFRCFTLHSGVTEEEFVNRLYEYIEIAKILPNNKRLWVLLDEFNTSPLQALLAEIMVERKCTFSPLLKEIPKNIVFAACCNPYRKKMETNSKSVGLVHESSKSALSHKVFPIPDSLINYVWDFGQLSKEAEEKYIDAIISSKAKGNYSYLKEDRYKVSIRVGVTTSQNYVREIENDSSVSLRDVQRFIKLFKFLHGERINGHLINSNEGHFYSHLDALSLTITMCYLLRIGDKNHRKKLSQEIQRRMGRFLQIRSNNFEIQKVFDKEATLIAHAANDIGCIPDDISLNKPLKENLFVCLCCVQNQIPVLMCGKPGTSKTVSIEILKSILSSTLRESKKRLKRFTPCSMNQFWGSLNTTADSIQKLFDKAKAEYLKNPDQNRAIIFDEVGLAEIAPDNPLKVLHPLLDPSSEDESKLYKKLVKKIREKLEKERQSEEDEDQGMIEAKTKISNKGAPGQQMVGFIGISNWRLDVSKMNRILFVSRPDMDEDDLRDTCETIFEATAERINLYEEVDERIIKSHKKSMGKMWEIIASVYFNFRELEMKKAGHKNFHGSRDFYSLVKYIINHLNAAVFKKLRRAKDFRKYLSAIVAAGIERNFSGKEIDSGSEGLVSASIQVKKLFLEKMEEEKYDFSSEVLERNTPVFQLIRSNLESEKSRHLMIFTDGAYLDNIIVDQIKKFKKEEQIRLNPNESNPEPKVVYFMRSEGKDDVFDITTKLPQYIEEDYTVIMKDLDDVYGCLYDLLNQKYKNIDGQDYCNIFYDDHKKQFKVNKKFRIVLLMEREDSKTRIGGKEQPAPFLNRFEKHLVKYESLMDEPTKNKLESFKTMIEKNLSAISKMNARGRLPQNLLIHNYNEELLVSLVCEEDKKKFMDGADLVDYDHYSHLKGKLDLIKSTNTEENFIRGNKFANVSIDSKKFTEMSDKLIRMFSRNAVLCFMHNYKSLYEEKESREKEEELITKFLKRHKMNSLIEFLPKFQKAKTTRAIIFTYTYAYELESILQKYKYQKSVLLLTANQINRQGASSKSKPVLDYFNKPDINTIIIQFADRKEWHYIEYIKSIIDDIFMERNENEELKYKDKKVIFIAQYSAEDYSSSYEIKTSINFMTDEWIMLVVDDLVDSDYKNFFNLMSMKISDFLNSQELSEDLLKSIVVEKIVELYNESINNSEDRELFLQIVSFFESQDEFFDKIIKALRRIQEENIYSEVEGRIYEFILEQGLLRNLSMDYKDTLKSVLKEVYGDNIEKCLMEMNQKFRLMDRIIFEKYSKDSKEMSVLKEKWDKNFNEFQIDVDKLDRYDKKKFTLQNDKSGLGPLTFTISQISNFFSKVNEELNKMTDFKNLLEIGSETCLDLKEKLNKIEAISKKALKIAVQNQNEENSFDMEDLQELAYTEIIAQIFGKTIFSLNDHQAIQKFIIHILTSEDEGKEGFFSLSETKEKDKKGVKLETFIAFCHLYKQDIKVLASISKNSKKLDMNSEKNLRKFLNDFQKGKNFSIDTLIGTNLSMFIKFNLKTELKENIKIFFTLKEEYSQSKSRTTYDHEFYKILEFLLMLLRHSLKIRTFKKQIIFKKKVDPLVNSIHKLIKIKEGEIKKNELLSSAVTLGELIKTVNEYDLSIIGEELVTKIFNFFVESLIENEEELSEEVIYEALRYLMRTTFELEFPTLKADYSLNLLANAITNNLNFDWERNYEVIRNGTKFATEFENILKFDSKDELKMKFCMILSDSILRRFIRLRKDKKEEENEEMTTINFGMEENEKDIMLDIIRKISLKKIHVDEMRNNKLLEFLTNISMFRYVFTRPKSQIKCFNEIDNLASSYYKTIKTQPLALFIIQRITNTIGEAGIKNNHLNKIRAIKGELYQNHENKFIFPNKALVDEMANIRKAAREISGGETVTYEIGDVTNKRLAVLSNYVDIYLNQEREDKEEMLEVIKNMINKRDTFIEGLMGKTVDEIKNSFPQTFTGVDNGNEIVLSVILNFFMIMEVSQDFEWEYHRRFLNRSLNNVSFLVKKPEDNYSTYLDLSRNTALGTRIWECRCGYPFVVADCGQLNQGGTCPECKTPIGGIGNHKAGDRGQYQKNTGSLGDLTKKVTDMKKALKTGYKDHRIDNLSWGLVSYPDLRNYPTVIFSHMLTELILLYKSLKKKMRPNYYKKHLDKIFNDFELLRRELAKDHLSIGYLLSGLHFLMYDNMNRTHTLNVPNFIQHTISRELANANRFIINYNRTKNTILEHQTSNNEIIRNLIARAVTVKDLDQVFGKNEILLTKFLRDFKEFNDADFDKYISKGKEDYKFIDTLQTNYELFKRFRECLFPLIKFSLYLTDHYSLTVTKQEAMDTNMEKFVRKKRDKRLRAYYEEARNVFEGEDKLIYLIQNYDNLLKFSIGCESFDDLGEKIKGKEAKMVMFMLTNGRSDQEVFMSVIINGLINLQNVMIENVNNIDIFREVNKKDENFVEIFEWEKKNDQKIENMQVDIRYLKEEHILHLDNSSLEMLKNTSTLSTEFLRENEFLPHLDDLKRICARNFFEGKRKIKKTEEMMNKNYFKFKGEDLQPLTDLIDSYFNFALISEKKRDKIQRGLKKVIENIEDMKQILKIESLLRKVIFELENNYVVDKEKLALSVLDKKFINIYGLKKAHQSQLMNLQVKQLKNFTSALMEKKGQLVYPDIKKILKNEQPRGSVVKKFKKAIKQKLNNLKKKRKLLQELYLGLLQIDTEPKIANRGSYQVDFFPGEFECLIEKYNIIEAMKMKGSEKLVLNDLVWMIDELKKIEQN